jgi:hypothetical protein
MGKTKSGVTVIIENLSQFHQAIMDGVIITPFRMLNSVKEIEALPSLSVIQLISENGEPKTLEKLTDQGWFWPGVETPYTTVRESWLPARLLYHPDWDKK